MNPAAIAVTVYSLRAVNSRTAPSFQIDCRHGTEPPSAGTRATAAGLTLLWNQCAVIGFNI
jgi:hypothetical protein